MARSSTKILDAGERFPQLTLNLVGGGTLSLPDGLEQPWNVILFYRGHWCPYCRAQLTAFSKGLPKLTEEGVGVVAASVDDEASTAEMIREAGIQFPIGHGLSLSDVPERFGAFIGSYPEIGKFIQTTGFVLGPDRTIVTSVYSSGPIGRLVWQDVHSLVQYIKKGE